MASQLPASATQMPTTSDHGSSRSTSAAESKPQQILKAMVFTEVMSDNWVEVLKIYKDNEDIQTASITSSKETVLHMAISNNRKDVALKLLDALAKPDMISEMKDNRSNNPLHLAASLGHADMCEEMVKRDPELIWSFNRDGESPSFLAAHHGKKEAFFTLQRQWEETNRTKPYYDISHCTRDDGNSILHVTILGEYFELAFHIIHLYPKLSTDKNHEGKSALHILATNPSAFKSGYHLGSLDDFIYCCLPVEKMEVNTRIVKQNQSSNETKSKIPGNYESCFSIIDIFRKGIGAGPGGKMIDG